MDRRGDHLTALQAIDAARGALGERRKAGPGFAQRPFQQIVLAAADDRRRGRTDHAGWARQPRKHPEVQPVARKQPLARHLAAGDGARCHEFIELALPEPDIGGGLARRHEFHPAFVCIFMLLFNRLTKCGNSCRTRRVETAMSEFSAWQLILNGDATLFAIVRLSLAVSLFAVALAALTGLPFGALLALTRFPGRAALVVLLNALMGLPPVVVGLAVYLLLSRAGPLGGSGILFTPSAMVIAQTILIAPIIAALTRQTVEDLWTEYRDELTAMDVSPIGRMTTLLWDARFSLMTALLAGFGRAAAEVGAVMIVGGNIDGFTRTMTTAISLETSKGDLPLALGLGIILVAIVLAVNAAAWGTRVWSERQAG